LSGSVRLKAKLEDTGWANELSQTGRAVELSNE
jgi:hypothetical protein